VAVFFYDFYFDTEDWMDREAACVAGIDNVRHQLNGRESRLLVVLIQRSPHNPSGKIQLLFVIFF